jgi:hypothetical protein
MLNSKTDESSNSQQLCEETDVVQELEVVEETDFSKKMNGFPPSKTL